MATGFRFSRFLRSCAGIVLGACVSTALAMPFTGMVQESPDPELRTGFVGVLVMGSVIVSLFALPTGLIGHAFLYWLKWRGLPAYLLAGALAGLAFAGVTILDGNPRIVHDSMLYGLWAAACAATAWMVRRPDKDSVSVLPSAETHF